MSAIKGYVTRLSCVLLTVIPSCVVYAHGPWGVQPLEWENDQIGKVIALKGAGHKTSIEGKDCLAGGVLNFDVRDDYAFDIDETVWLDVEFYLGPSNAKLSPSEVIIDDSRLSVDYDRNDAAPFIMTRWSAADQRLQPPKDPNDHWYKESIPLERARFANLGFDGSDFTIRGSYNDGTAAREFALCKLSLRRSYTTPVAKVFGWIEIEVDDERGQRTPARMGIYDSSGRLPLPGAEAVLLRKSTGGGVSRVVTLGEPSPWPVKNRSVFYVDGRYHSRLPVGEYDLIVAKGPEYRLARKRFTVTANDTKPIKIQLQRWADMAAQGWYSGEDHIHYRRDSKQDDHDLLLFTQAEDLRVANILQFGNSAVVYSPQYDWKPVSADNDASFVLIPGQEDPRTSRRGHTVELNIRAPLRNPSRYLLYHEIFGKVRAQGGLAGYAHVTTGHDPKWVNTTTGMAIDVPFELVDFAEIFSMQFLDGSTWFDFLNLGYKLPPTAGTDYEGGGLVPGAVRNYVKVDKSFTPQTWFDALKQGHTFVTDGPMLEMSVNGEGMGGEIHVKRGAPLVVEAKASLNPDLDALSSLELIEQGVPVKIKSSKHGASEIEFHYDLPAKHGTWFVLRAVGKNANVIALSAPTYVFVDGQGFWKPEKVPAIVANLKLKMQELLRPNQLELCCEPWETREVDAKYEDAQRSALEERIRQASLIYDDLVKRATALTNQP